MRPDVASGPLISLHPRDLHAKRRFVRLDLTPSTRKAKRLFAGQVLLDAKKPPPIFNADRGRLAGFRPTWLHEVPIA